MVTSRWWGWTLALVPLLAVVAYATVLRIGFVSDDFVLLGLARQSGLDLSVFVPAPHWYLYRPLGYILVWELGWQLWGLNPLPYHVEALLLHAGTSLLLALWVVEATTKRALGLLAGALFAVFPLHLETIGWAASVWDALAVFFGLFSLWLFTRWWRLRGSLLLYLLSVFLYALAIFTKESTLSFLPVFGLAGWLAAPHRRGGMQWGSLAVALLPLCAALSLNAGLRLVSWGHLGGYGGTRTDYGALLQVFWDKLIAFAHMILSPINSTLVGNTTSQLMGAFSSVALLVGLVWFGRRLRRLLLVVGAWMLLSVAPVLNLAVNVDDLESSRFFYLMSAGYCVGVAALLYEAWLAARRWRSVVAGAIGVLVLLSIGMCWVQLQPWHTATVQVAEIQSGLERLIPVGATGKDETWYVENMPDSYHGAYVFRLGFGGERGLLAGKRLMVQKVENASEAPMAGEKHDTFGLRYEYFGDQTRYGVTYAAGISEETSPSSEQAGEQAVLWDFRNCSSSALSSWEVRQAQVSCERGKGLVLRPSSDDPQMVSTNVRTEMPAGASGGWVRLRVAARYAPSADAGQRVSQWFWQGQGKGWGEERSKSVPVREDGKAYVYWAFVPGAEVKEGITGWRFDPVNSQLGVEIEWVAIDVVR